MSAGAGSAPQLLGIRVLVTRPRERARELCFLLEDEGAEVVSLPLLELLPPDDPRPLRAAADRISRYAWCALASPAAVSALVDAVREAGMSEHLAALKIAAVGPRTAQVARACGLCVELEEAGTGATLGLALAPLVAAREEVLLAAAQEGRPELEQALVEAGLKVTRVAAYRSEQAPLAPGVLDEALEPMPEVGVFASPRTVEAFLAVAGEKGRALLSEGRTVAIGPTTAAALREAGARRLEVASAPTAMGLVEAAVRAAQG